jgi:hypothetical protein
VAGPGQHHAVKIRRWVSALNRKGRTVAIEWVKGHAGVTGNERADVLAGTTAERNGQSTTMSIAHLMLKISERFKNAKEAWHKDPAHHGSEEIPPPPLKKSCLDGARNAIARTAAQIRTGHWRSAIYMTRIRRRFDGKCWFCNGTAKMTRSHVLFHCPNARLRAARAEAWEGKNPGGFRVLLAIPTWERPFGAIGGGEMGRKDGVRAARMDELVIGRRGEDPPLRNDWYPPFLFSFSSLLQGPRDLRTAHCRGRRIHYVRSLPAEGWKLVPFVRVHCTFFTLHIPSR